MYSILQLLTEVTAIKVLGKKVSGKKSYQFETLFSRTFFSGSSMIYTKKSSEKSPIRGENAWFTIEKSPGCKHPINNHRFSGAWYLNTPGYIFNMEKSPFYENFSDWTLFPNCKLFPKKKYKIFLIHMYIFMTS